MRKTTAKKRGRLSFIGETIAELKKVVWPTRQEALRLSIMVLIVCIIIGAFLALFDYGFTELARKVFLSGG